MPEFPGNPLNDSAALWVAEPEAPGGDVLPYGWVWAAMPPAERRMKMRELADWVSWLTATFELHNRMPPCWYRHTAVVEHLTALYAAWVRSYCTPTGHRELAEVEWISMLHAFAPHLQVASCATGTHQEPPPRSAVRPDAQEAFETYLMSAAFGTAEAVHPAADEVLRRNNSEPQY
ncbi:MULTISPECIES: hypothetical protein [Streptomyces]|nr:MULTISPECIES: hypothetical protein [Streptomyces]